MVLERLSGVRMLGPFDTLSLKGIITSLVDESVELRVLVCASLVWAKHPGLYFLRRETTR